MSEEVCGKTGPKGPCGKKPGHVEDDHSMHEYNDGNGSTSLWGDDWKPNKNRTTWRSD